MVGAAPRHLSTDHDPLFEAQRWTANLRILEIDAITTVPHVPLWLANSTLCCKTPWKNSRPCNSARIRAPLY